MNTINILRTYLRQRDQNTSVFISDCTIAKPLYRRKIDEKSRFNQTQQNYNLCVPQYMLVQTVLSSSTLPLFLLNTIKALAGAWLDGCLWHEDVPVPTKCEINKCLLSAQSQLDESFMCKQWQIGSSGPCSHAICTALSVFTEYFIIYVHL